MEEDLKQKLYFLNEKLDELKKVVHSSNVDKNIYILNLSDISEKDLNFAFEKILLTYSGKFFPTIFEIRKFALENEARIVHKFLKKVQEQIANTKVSFENLRVKTFIIQNGGWENIRKKIQTIKEDEFINLYVSTKI